MFSHKTAYLSPKLSVYKRPQKGGFGIFAQQALQVGELVAVWSGEILNWEQFRELPLERRRHTIQVEEALYLTSQTCYEPADYINHSCNPNAGLDGQIALRTMRDIAIGEEVCYDYAMSDGSPYDEFDCTCGELSCRHHITGDDWRIPDLQIKYLGYFSPYLQRRITQLNQQKSMYTFKYIAKNSVFYLQESQNSEIPIR